MSNCSQCTGHCCRRFNLQYSSTEWKRIEQAIHDGKNEFELDSGNMKEIVFNKDEALQIAGMIISLGKSDLDHNMNPMLAKNVVKLATGYTIEGDKVFTEWFTCKNYNTETNLCSIYENRPRMCRIHPGFDKCNYKGCTYKDEDMIAIEKYFEQGGIQSKNENIDRD